MSIERLSAGEYAWLAALAARETLGAAIEAAQRAEETFDFASVLAVRGVFYEFCKY